MIHEFEMEPTALLAIRSSVLLGVSIVVIILISWACRNNRSKQSLDASSPASALLKLIKVHLNPRISRLAVGYRLEKVCAAGKRWQCFGVVFWNRFCEKPLSYLRLWIRARQEKIIMGFWCDVHGLPRKQYKSMAISGATVMNPNLADGKRQVFRLVDECHTKDTTTICWVGDAGCLDSEWESLLYNGQPKSDKLPNPVPCCDYGRHSHVRVARTPNSIC